MILAWCLFIFFQCVNLGQPGGPGFQGPSGWTGAPGFPGPSGFPGGPGFSGAPGGPGFPGATGFPGPSGLPGTAGKQICLLYVLPCTTSSATVLLF